MSALVEMPPGPPLTPEERTARIKECAEEIASASARLAALGREVYVVESCTPYEGCTILAVFETQELAEQYKLRCQYPGDIEITPWRVATELPAKALVWVQP